MAGPLRVTDFNTERRHDFLTINGKASGQSLTFVGVKYSFSVGYQGNRIATNHFWVSPQLVIALFCWCSRETEWKPTVVFVGDAFQVGLFLFQGTPFVGFQAKWQPTVLSGSPKKRHTPMELRPVFFFFSVAQPKPKRSNRPANRSARPTAAPRALRG